MLAWVRHRLAVGELKPGDRLPDRKWFCREFGLSEHSVQQAFDELAKDGLVKSVPGHGTRVPERLEFMRRVLIVLGADEEDAGRRLFAPALKAAAEIVARRRGIAFDIREVADAGADSRDYAQVLSDLRSQRYLGAVVQAVTELEHGLETVTNVDDVPMAYFGVRSEFTQGDRAVPLQIYEREWMKRLYERHFTELAARGCRKVAVFRPIVKDCDRRELVDPIAASCGVEIVRDGFHLLDMLRWKPVQFDQLLGLFVHSDAGREADSIVLGDDNMLSVFEAYCRRSGLRLAARYRVSCHCNFPLLPRATTPVDFHGPDLVACLDSFVDYAEDVRAGVRRPRLPRLDVL